jgi:hypothetical protein
MYSVLSCSITHSCKVCVTFLTRINGFMNQFDKCYIRSLGGKRKWPGIIHARWASTFAILTCPLPTLPSPTVCETKVGLHLSGRCTPDDLCWPGVPLHLLYFGPPAYTKYAGVEGPARNALLEQNMAESTLMQNSVVISVLGCLNDSKMSSDAIMQNISICWIHHYCW